MDFGTIELDNQQQQFRDEINALLDEHLAERGPERRRYGPHELVDPVLVQKLAERGLLMPGWPIEEGGAGLDRVCRFIVDFELRRRGIDGMGSELVWSAVRRFGHPDLVAELKPRVASGEVRFCLGYTEPDGGSDIAAAKTRAVRDGDEWVINGSKVFTTSAHISQYIFLITRTDPDKPKHRGLTMFLVPTDWPGVEVHQIQTIGEEETNVTYYGDVRLPDKYRLGEVDEGWTVLRGPLDAEHDFAQANDGLTETMGCWAMERTPTYVAFEATLEWARTSIRPDGLHPIDDPTVQLRLGRVAADLEWAMCSIGPLGRVAGAETNVRATAELCDIVGPEALLPYGADGALDGGDLERAHRFAQATITYGGCVEVFRQMIAQHVLGLPRPQYPGSKNLVRVPSA